MSKASIIIPVYKTQEFLPKCIDSIMEQTFQNFDVILINDCSPDKSQDVIDTYVEKYPDKIRSIQNDHNLGQGQSRMKGVQSSDSEYILFVDSDDYLAKDYLSTFIEQVEEEAYDIVVAGFTKVMEGKEIRHDIEQNDWTLVCYPLACCKMYRRDFIIENQIDFSTVRRGEDIYFSLAAFCCDPKVKFISYFGYHYLLNTNSTTESMDASSRIERTVSKMFHLLSERFSVDKLEESRRQKVEYAYLANMINALITYGHGCGPKIMKEKYEFFKEDLNHLFPEWKQNPNFHYLGFHGPNNRIKLGVCITMNLMKLHLAWPLYFVLSLV